MAKTSAVLASHNNGSLAVRNARRSRGVRRPLATHGGLVACNGLATDRARRACARVDHVVHAHLRTCASQSRAYARARRTGTQRDHAYTHERLNACEHCALAAPRVLRLGGALCLAPCALTMSYASATLRAWRLGGLRFDGASHLAPQRRFALRLSAAPQPLATPFALRLDGVLQFVPRRCLAICGASPQ